MKERLHWIAFLTLPWLWGKVLILNHASQDMAVWFSLAVGATAILALYERFPVSGMGSRTLPPWPVWLVLVAFWVGLGWTGKAWFLENSIGWPVTIFIAANWTLFGLVLGESRAGTEGQQTAG